MLILLPFANIIVLGIALMGRRVAMPARRRWPSCFLLASSLTGAWLVVLTENLRLVLLAVAPHLIARGGECSLLFRVLRSPERQSLQIFLH